ncbi:MAG: beta-ketoacyl synthase chain length factor [Altibacter sp.]|uniref:beta-ketoacyl synthase N-terminal-like domain-containing protein n=1 Tax=Altibacter sp. TaxID=2024823 RepID=UPI001D61936C|nr:beta-ketoacyl synthase N-terminal-like domain-containing protein [Altibacter sp.]MBZ0328488.1 beta-ketoacyl synthase chain length factor [Altibacter sp.]
MKRVFIQSVGSVSCQKTFDNSQFLDEIEIYEANVVPAIDPAYKDYIPPAAARRMAKGIKMGIVASKIALSDAGLDSVDAIITGTGMGCLVESEKFVSAIIDNKEEYLTPTSFIQSTHNTVGGQIALDLECKGYNFTYVHSSISFESALLDAQLQLAMEEAETILVGGVDELGAHTVKIHKLVHHIKAEMVSSARLLESNTEGAVFGEGANFFVLSNQKKEGAYAELLAVDILNTLDKEDLSQSMERFLATAELKVEDIDLLVMGNNGDVVFDTYYRELSDGLFSKIPQAYYKHLSGEFNTASSFGVWLASKILKFQQIPEDTKLNSITSSKLNRILLYNQYRGQNHSFVLLQKC